MKPYLQFLFLIALVNTATAQTWKKVDTENSCTARHECAGAALDDKLYLVGGRGMKPVEEYNPATNSWKVMASTPLEMHHFQAVTYNDKIYVIGAFTGGYPHETGVPNVYIYDPEINEWEKSHEIPEARRRGATGVVLHNDKFYIMGGAADGHWGDNRNYMDEYDPKTGKWRELPDMPRVRDHFSAVVVDGKIYASGGRKSFAAEGYGFELTYGEVDVYDFETNSWETLPESMNLPTQRAGSSAITFEKGFLILGGESSSQVVAHDEVEYFIPDQGWQPFPNLERGRHGFQVVQIGNDLYLAAGCGNRGGSPELDSLEKYEASDH